MSAPGNSHGDVGAPASGRDGCPSLGGGSLRVAASSRELGQTHLAEEMFGQWDKWTEFHVWQMWCTMTRFCNM